MALVTTVTVTTVGGTTFAFTGDAGASALRSISLGAAIDAVADDTRTIIPFGAINHALTTVESAESEPVEDANCVVRTPEETP